MPSTDLKFGIKHKERVIKKFSTNLLAVDELKQIEQLLKKEENYDSSKYESISKKTGLLVTYHSKAKNSYFVKSKTGDIWEMVKL